METAIEVFGLQDHQEYILLGTVASFDSSSSYLI